MNCTHSPDTAFHWPKALLNAMRSVSFSVFCFLLVYVIVLKSCCHAVPLFIYLFIYLFAFPPELQDHLVNMLQNWHTWLHHPTTRLTQKSFLFSSEQEKRDIIRPQSKEILPSSGYSSKQFWGPVNNPREGSAWSCTQNSIRRAESPYLHYLLPGMCTAVQTGLTSTNQKEWTSLHLVFPFFILFQYWFLLCRLLKLGK